MWRIMKRSHQFSQSSKTSQSAVSAAERRNSVRKDERRDLHKSRRGGRDVRTYPHTVSALGSCCRNCRQHGLWHQMLRKWRNGAQKQVIWQSVGRRQPSTWLLKFHIWWNFSHLTSITCSLCRVNAAIGHFLPWSTRQIFQGKAQGKHCMCRDCWHCSTEQPHGGYSGPDAQSGGAEGTALFQHCLCMKPVVTTFPPLGALFGSEGQAQWRSHLQDHTQTSVRAHDTVPCMLGSLRLL